MRVRVNPDLCIGMGLCEELCPEVFKVEKGVSTVKVSRVPSDAEIGCRQAAEGCPVSAIFIEE